jgi:small multidrug resistance family-3 protein
MGNSGFPSIAWLIFLAAAVLEVGGDAVIRKGMRSGGWMFIATGCFMLAAYGVVVNLVKWDFSKLLGVYVAVFAAVSVLAGRFLFDENVAGWGLGSLWWAGWSSSSANAEFFPLKTGRPRADYFQVPQHLEENHEPDRAFSPRPCRDRRRTCCRIVVVHPRKIWSYD